MDKQQLIEELDKLQPTWSIDLATECELRDLALVSITGHEYDIKSAVAGRLYVVAIATNNWLKKNS